MKAKNWIQLILLLGIILLGVFASMYENKKLHECSQEGKAVIISKSKRKSRGYFIKYKYFVNDKSFTTSESIKKRIDIDNLEIGDTIDVMISCDDFNVSRYKTNK